MNTEVELLKRIAVERYDIDMGFLLETSDQADYERLIAEHGTAEAAWTAHLDILETRKENGGYYEKF